MAAPIIVITDHLLATSGDLNIEVGHAAHFECVSASIIGAGDWHQAKIVWSMDDTGSDYSSGIRGFNFSHYFATTGTFTVTCIVTNVDGGSDTETRTIIVAASTRSTVNVSAGADLKTVHDANIGANKEFVLAGNVTCSGTIAPSSNNVFRSSVAGTLVNVAWTGSSGSFFNLSAVDSVTWKDLKFTLTGGTRSVSIIQFAGTNNNVIDCEVVSGVCSGQMLNGASSPRGLLIQDTVTVHDSVGQCIWMGNNVDSRMATVYGGSHIANEDNGERVVRGAGLYISFVDSYLEQQNIANAKEPMSINGSSYYYLYRTQLVNSTASGTGGILLCGHTSGTTAVSDIVLDRCRLSFPNRVGRWQIGAATSSCTRLMTRNCIFRNVVLVPEKLSLGRFHHNTFYNPTGGLRWIHSEIGPSGLIVTGNLSVWGASITEAILMDTTTNTATEFTLISNNITGTPTQEDVDINDTVNGNKDEQYVTFNARANADGNLRKTIAINTTSFRPIDTEDTDLIITEHADMNLFQEDYHGNPRTSGLFIIGAVGIEPVVTANPAFLMFFTA